MKRELKLIQMSNFCWKCHQEVDPVIHFKTLCENCYAYLHSCSGCRFYMPGKANDCLIPGTEPIRDREANNYCEEFKSLTERKQVKGPNLDDVSKRLFND